MGRSLSLIGLLLSLLCPPASAQIAFVGGADLGNNGGSGTSLSGSYTAGSKANEVLVVCLQDFDQTSDGSTETLSYNGVNLTFVANTWAVLPQDTSMWYLLNPASGSNTLSYSRSSGPGTYIQMMAADYSQVRPSGQLDNSGGTADSGANNTYSGATSTNTNGAGLVGCATADGGAGTPSTSGAYTTRVTEAAFNNALIADDVNVTSHGTVTFTATITTADAQQQNFLSFLAVPGGGGLLLRGVGQ